MSFENEVTLIIPALGRPVLTKKLIDSLNESAAKYPIILVDDGTKPPLCNQLPEYSTLRIKYIYNGQSVGPATARNIGIWNCNTPFVAFTDNDVTVTSQWLQTLYFYLLNAPSDVVGVGGQVIDDGSNFVGRYSTCLQLLNPFIYKSRVLYLVTANCLFRRDALIQVGGFDESFKLPGGEDPDICFRLLKAGYRLEYEPSAKVIHHYTSSWWGFYRMFLRYGIGCQKAMQSLTKNSTLSYP